MTAQVEIIPRDSPEELHRSLLHRRNCAVISIGHRAAPCPAPGGGGAMNSAAAIRLTSHRVSGRQPPRGRRAGFMTDEEYQPVAVSRRIGAPARDIFRILANPARHPEFDGSGSLRGAGTTEPISAVGDVFVMKMFFAHLGDYEMNNHVVEYELDRRVG